MTNERKFEQAYGKATLETSLVADNGVAGEAFVWVPDNEKNRSFIGWLQKTGRGHRWFPETSWILWITDWEKSYSRKTVMAQAIAKFLNRYGLEVYAGSFIDDELLDYPGQKATGRADAKRHHPAAGKSASKEIEVTAGEKTSTSYFFNPPFDEALTSCTSTLRQAVQDLVCEYSAVYDESITRSLVRSALKTLLRELRPAERSTEKQEPGRITRQQRHNQERSLSDAKVLSKPATVTKK